MVSNLDYVNNGELLTTIGTTSVYKLNGELYMESGSKGNLISAEEDLRNYIWRLGKKPHGDVLVLGLGLGFNVKYLLSLPKINSITVIEPNNDVVMCQQIFNQFDTNENITTVNSDFLKYMYENRNKFDFVFIDCYRQIDSTTWPLVADLIFAAKYVCKISGIIVGWADDSASDYWLKAFEILFT